jgi:hypothetical protein
MLAAVGGLVYTLSTLLKLQSYFGYLLPLPVVLAAMRNGPAAGRRTVSATAFLLLGARPPPLSRRTQPPPGCYRMRQCTHHTHAVLTGPMAPCATALKQAARPWLPRGCSEGGASSPAGPWHMSTSSPARHTGSPAQKAARPGADLEEQSVCPSGGDLSSLLTGRETLQAGKACIYRRTHVQSSGYRGCEAKRKLASCLHGKALVRT